jgi:hypothetical protein
VSCKQHQFIRWDVPGGERFNIEANATSVDDPSDDYYRKWPYEITPQEEKEGCFLQSRTPRMDLADFLAQRGYRWLNRNCVREACRSFLWATASHPENKGYYFAAEICAVRWRREVEATMPRRFPELFVTFSPKRRFPESLPLDAEHYVILTELLEQYMSRPRYQEWWEALRRSDGEWPRHVPRKMHATLSIK